MLELCDIYARAVLAEPRGWAGQMPEPVDQPRPAPRTGRYTLAALLLFLLL